jgi:formamidopyrimidine-DNA glycosylase
MIEMPEAVVLAQQINEAVKGKRIQKVEAAKSPHKLAWYHGKPEAYHGFLTGKTVGNAIGIGSFVQINAEEAVILLSEGINLRYHNQQEERPKKHQLLIEFDDGTAISASVQMYGGLQCFSEGAVEDKYYKQAQEKPSPLTDAFTEAYFDSIVSAPGAEKLSAKALLATEQRIPGLGNGVLQDILFNAGIHPKKRVKMFTEEEKKTLYESIQTTLADMTARGGRDTEKDLSGSPGGYITKMSKNTANSSCPVCGAIIKKEAYMGGSIYYCSSCQKL